MGTCSGLGVIASEVEPPMSRLTVATAQTSPARKSLRFICSYLVGGADPSAASGERRSPSLDELKRSLARLVKVIVVDFGRPSHLRAHGLRTAAQKPGSWIQGGGNGGDPFSLRPYILDRVMNQQAQTRPASCRRVPRMRGMNPL